MRALWILMALGGCVADASATGDDASDAEAEAAATQAVGKADAPSFVGLYMSHATHHYDNDIPSLQLLPVGAGATDPAYVRSRCYHASCALELPETDGYDVYQSSAHKTYVRFHTITITRDASGDLTTHPTVADVYEIAATSSGVKLRKSYTTRWFTLYRTTEHALCTGAWDGASCTCPGDATVLFVPGAGGCISRPGDNESNCDASGGLWTDDDATLTGAYCVCGAGRHDDDDTGTCVAN